MAKQRHLRNAPITEALVDLRADLAQEFAPQRISDLQEGLQQAFPESNEIWAAQFPLKKGEVQPVGEGALHGLMLKSGDGCEVVQFRADGFTFSRLKPYTEWDTVFSDAQKYWSKYRKMASPELVTRIAVRYINHLTLPMAGKEFSDYLTDPPTAPTELRFEIQNFLKRLMVRDPDAGLTANVTQASDQTLKPGFATVILDIDAYKVKDFAPDDDKLWETFEALHVMKNDLFFGNITEEAARLFE